MVKRLGPGAIAHYAGKAERSSGAAEEAVAPAGHAGLADQSRDR